MLDVGLSQSLNGSTGMPNSAIEDGIECLSRLADAFGYPACVLGVKKQDARRSVQR